MGRICSALSESLRFKWSAILLADRQRASNLRGTSLGLPVEPEVGNIRAVALSETSERQLSPPLGRKSRKSFRTALNESEPNTSNPNQTREAFCATAATNSSSDREIIALAPTDSTSSNSSLSLLAGLAGTKVHTPSIANCNIAVVG